MATCGPRSSPVTCSIPSLNLIHFHPRLDILIANVFWKRVAASKYIHLSLQFEDLSHIVIGMEWIF